MPDSDTGLAPRPGTELGRRWGTRDDATALWLPERRLLFCGDAMEDTITYVGEPDGLDAHLRGLERLTELEPARILPSHGSPDLIADSPESGTLIYFEPYERVHRHNVETILSITGA